jgi:uncharacterized protein (DUF2267 family)
MDPRKLFKKRFYKKMLSGVDMVKIGVLDRLAERFQSRYGQETADSLAAAVVNELFSEVPSDPHAQEFLKLNKAVVERELSNLKHDDEICNAVTQAVRIKVSLSYEQIEDVRRLLPEHLEKLASLGILIATVETSTPSSFLRMANEFYQRK